MPDSLETYTKNSMDLAPAAVAVARALAPLLRVYLPPSFLTSYWRHIQLLFIYNDNNQLEYYEHCSTASNTNIKSSFLRPRLWVLSRQVVKAAP